MPTALPKSFFSGGERLPQRILAADFVTDVADTLYVGSTVGGIRYIRYHIRCQQRYLKVFSQAVKDSRNCPAI